MEKEQLNNIITWVLILIVLVLAYMVLKPILIAIIFGFIFGYIFRPVEKKLRKVFRNKTLSTIIMLVFLLSLIIIPIVSFTPTLIRQTFQVYGDLQAFDLSAIFNKISTPLLSEEIIHRLDTSLNSFINQSVNSIMQSFSKILINIPGILLQIFVTFFIFFFVIRDFEVLNKYIAKISPFSIGTGKMLSNEFKSVTNAVLMGQVLVGLIQGLLMGLGFLILGFNNILTLTVLSMVLSIIPIIGPWLVWGPAALFLLMQGDTTIAIILALYGAIFVSNIDNLIRPYFLSRSSNLPVVVSLVGTVGGLMVFGIIGLILGPLILAYALIVIEMYKSGKFTKLYKIERRDEIKSKKL